MCGLPTVRWATLWAAPAIRPAMRPMQCSACNAGNTAHNRIPLKGWQTLHGNRVEVAAYARGVRLWRNPLGL